MEPRTLLNAGDLDPTFGVGGKVLTDFVGQMIAAVAKATIIQPDGKILVAGSAGDTGTFRSLLGRYNTDGSPDASFGTGGRVTNTFFAASNGPTDLTLQQDGKIILVGADPSNPAIQGSSTFAVVRYNADGSLDSAFGKGGVVHTDIGSGISSATGVVVQSDGKIVVAGNAATGNVAVVRYTSDGSLDPTFGAAGKAITANLQAGNVALQPDRKIVVAGGAAVIRYNADGSLDGLLGVGSAYRFSRVGVQPDGKILTLATYTQTGVPYESFTMLVRLNPDGTIDSGFSTSALNQPVSQFGPFVIQADGKIDLLTVLQAPSEALTVLRLNPDGSADMTFGTQGKASADVGVLAGYNPLALAVAPDGKIVAIGTSYGSSLTQFALARFNPDGSPDSAFGTGGKEITGGFTGSVNATASRVAIQPDGKILVAGSFPTSLAVARYNSDGTLDASFGDAGQFADAEIANGLFSAAPSALVVQSDGKFLVLVGNHLKRYETDGNADATFQADLTSLGAVNLTLQPDGKIVVVGTSKIERLNPDGSPDTAFGTNGVVSVDFTIGSVALQGRGKIIVLGHQDSNSANPPLLVRYNSDGSLDTSFGTTGMVTISPGAQTPGIAVQPDGKIVIGSPAARFNPDGSLDEFFGINGRTLPIFAQGRVAIAPDGRIILGGNVFTPARGILSGEMVLKSNGTLDVRLGSSATVVPDFANADFALQSDGRILIVGTTTIAGHTSFTVARYFLSGISSLTPNQLFVAQVFPDLLQRPVDSAGLAHYSGLLESGVSRMQIVQQIESSDEYHKLVVTDLYRRILGRSPDDSGNATYTNFLNQGGTAEQVGAFLLGSDEYLKIAGGSNTGFLQAIYPLTLHRPIDSSGAQSWGQALAGGTSRSAVAAAILASLESDQLETEVLYANFLHRSPDPSGLDTFTNLLQRGVPDETVSAILIGSDEYFAEI
ncbi:MAG TPA: DUF4214 domain-containing protein [Gemmataceae bacterium]|nr:DUF4214 domain-containing protein [Gemmataceae bacterium]